MFTVYVYISALVAVAVGVNPIKINFKKKKV